MNVVPPGRAQGFRAACQTQTKTGRRAMTPDILAPRRSSDWTASSTEIPVEIGTL